MAILVGVGTVIEDDPELTARIPNGRNPIRVILDSSLRLPLDAKVVVDGAAETWIFTSRTYDHSKKEQLEHADIRIFETSGETQTDVDDLMRILGENGISSLFIEGGGTVNSAFLENRLIDKVVLYFAPKLVGGSNAPTFLEGRGFEGMKDAIDLADGEFTKIGKDFKFTGYPEK